jgi:hypothetical protein
VGKDLKHDEESTMKMAATPENLREENEKRDKGWTERRSGIGLNMGRVK